METHYASMATRERNLSRLFWKLVGAIPTEMSLIRIINCVFIEQSELPFASRRLVQITHVDACKRRFLHVGIMNNHRSAVGIALQC